MAEYACDRAGEARPYEAPAVQLHGSLAEVTSANIIGTEFDKAIPAGSSITAIFGGTSL